MAIYYIPQYKSTTLSVAGGIDSSQTTGIVLADIDGIDYAKAGIMCVNWSDPLNTSVCEYISFTSINNSTKELNGVTRGEEGIAAKAHDNGVAVAFVISKSHINNPAELVDGQTAGLKVKTAIYDTGGNEVIKTPATSSAVNEITVTNAATTTAPEISATGGDTNIDLKLKGKGTGHVQAYDNYSASYFDIVPNSSMARQAIMNGNFDVWQRGTSLAISSSGTYLADRWFVGYGLGGGTLPTDTVSRQLLTSGALANSFYHWRLNVDGAGSGFGTAANYSLAQNIEHGTRNLCGASKTVTLSFYAKSDIADKKLGVFLLQTYGTTGSPTAAETIAGTNWTLTSSWTKYTHTFTTNTLDSKTFGTDYNDYLQVNFQMMWGTDYDDRVGASGAEDFRGSGNIDIAQVQLCAGEVALPFQPKSYAQELADCQRYYYHIQGSAGALYTRLGAGQCYSATNTGIYVPFPVTMRTNPTLVQSGNYGVTSAAGVIIAGSTIAITAIADAIYGAQVDIVVAGGLTAGHATVGTINNSATAYVAFSAEL